MAYVVHYSISYCIVLCVDLWLQWVRDELPLVSVPEAGLELRQLFERASSQRPRGWSGTETAV